MSSLIVEVCKVQQVDEHPNADRMCICTVKGWKVCAKKVDGKNEYEPGDKCVYFPPDCVLTGELARNLGVDKYLQPMPKNPDGSRPDAFRIRVARLRGERSYGLIIPCEDQTWPVGHSVVEYYGVTKWEPPAKCTDGDAERPNPSFFKYTDIEHLQNFPDVIKEGEEVVITEKLHGKNTRLGLIREADEDGNEDFIYMVGSHGVRRKEIGVFNKVKKDDNGDPVLDDEGNPVIYQEFRRSQFWDCLSKEVVALLDDLCKNENEVIVYGEMIGQGVQDMTYGIAFGFRAFDVMVNGKFIDYDDKKTAFEKHGVPHVPILYRGPFSKKIVDDLVDGPTTMIEAGILKNQFAGREGVVITPTKEREDRGGKPGTGRVIFKCVSFDYLNRKGGTEDH